LLDFSQEHRQVRVIETDQGCWHTMMLDVWWDVLVMWIADRQGWIFGVWVIVIPVNLVPVVVHLVAIGCDQARVKIKLLQHAQPESLRKQHLPFGNPCVGVDRPHHEGRVQDTRTIYQTSNEVAILCKRAEGIGPGYQ
jgi:hypothetical protein